MDWNLFLQYLAKQYDYTVIGVETQSQLVEKVNEKKSFDRFHMITYNIYNKLQASELEAVLFKCPVSYGFIGLHCCGDLSASMCRLFTESASRCKILSFVGCCYNLLTTREDCPDGVYGFPMNPEVISVVLSHRTRNMIVQNTQYDSLDDLKATLQRLFYRALLQVVICKFFPEECVLLSIF